MPHVSCIMCTAMQEMPTQCRATLLLGCSVLGLLSADIQGGLLRTAHTMRAVLPGPVQAVPFPTGRPGPGLHTSATAVAIPTPIPRGLGTVMGHTCRWKSGVRKGLGTPVQTRNTCARTAMHAVRGLTPTSLPLSHVLWLTEGRVLSTVGLLCTGVAFR